MDVRVARAVARSQGMSVHPVLFSGIGKGGDGFPISHFAKLARDQCQLIMGFPIDAGGPNLPPHVEATEPYASTGFVLVRRSGSQDVSLGALRNGSEVGIAQLDTYAGLLFSEHPNIVMHVYPEDEEMLADLQARQIVAGLAWQPSIERYRLSHPRQNGFSVHILPGKHMVWNLVALYAPESHAAAESFNKGLIQLRSNGRLARLIAPYQSIAGPQDPPTAGAAARIVNVADIKVATVKVATVNVATAKVAASKKRNSTKKHRGPPALYTEEQATKGATAYYQNCAMCHGPALDGQSGGYSGPALKGADFADPSYNFHVDEIFNFVAKLMPAATPGSLPPDQDVTIMAFILKQNGYPAGAQELTYADAQKSRVPLRYYGK